VSRLYKEIERDNYETSEVPKKVTLMEILNNERHSSPLILKKNSALRMK